MNKYMEMACRQAEKGMKNNEGGPFGAVIVKGDEIISCENNKVLTTCDPTAHAEVNAIREASKKLQTFDLSDCVLYTTSEPCPMCMSAIIWANIKTIYYGTNRIDVESIGFKDNFIYEYLSGQTNEVVKKEQIDKEECKKLLEQYNNTIY